MPGPVQLGSCPSRTVPIVRTHTSFDSLVANTCLVSPTIFLDLFGLGIESSRINILIRILRIPKDL